MVLKYASLVQNMISHTATDPSIILKPPMQKHPKHNLFSYTKHVAKSCWLHFSMNSNPFFLLQPPLLLYLVQVISLGQL